MSRKEDIPDLQDKDIESLFDSYLKQNQALPDIPASIDQALIEAAEQTPRELIKTEQEQNTDIRPIHGIAPVKSHRGEPVSGDTASIESTPDPKSGLSRVWPQFFAAAAVLVLAVTVIPLLHNPSVDGQFHDTSATISDAANDEAENRLVMAEQLDGAVRSNVPANEADSEADSDAAGDDVAQQTMAATDPGADTVKTELDIQFEAGVDVGDRQYDGKQTASTPQINRAMSSPNLLPNPPAITVAESVREAAGPSVSPIAVPSASQVSADILPSREADSVSTETAEIESPNSANFPAVAGVEQLESMRLPSGGGASAINGEPDSTLARVEQSEKAQVSSVNSHETESLDNSFKAKRNRVSSTKPVTSPAYRSTAARWRAEIVKLIERDEISRAKIEYTLLLKQHPDFSPKLDLPWSPLANPAAGGVGEQNDPQSGQVANPDQDKAPDK